MRNTTLLAFMGMVVFLSLTVSAVAAPLEIVGTLRNVDQVPLSGRITVIQETRSGVTFTHHEVDKTGLFEVSMSDAQGGLVLHAAAPGHPAGERVIPAGTTGVVEVDFVLPLGQNVQVRVVDDLGQGVTGAALRVRYHEPGKPLRRVGFDHQEVTDGDGRLMLRGVGIQVPFFVDVLAPHYPPASSQRTKLDEGETKMDDVVLGKPSATVVVELVDKAGDPVSNAGVRLIADPAGYPAEARGSWLHPLAFRQRAVTSAQGHVRFTGVPPGRILVRVKTPTSATQQQGVAVSGEELRLSLRTP